MNVPDEDASHQAKPSESLSEVGADALDQFYDLSMDELSADELHPLFSKLVGMRVRYEIYEELGRGAMKKVLRARDLNTDRDVALARLLPKFEKDSFDTFLREARLNARLEHPNIIKVHDLGVLQGRPFFSMELKPGLTLGSILDDLKNSEKREDYPLEKRLEIFLKICDAVAYAHSRQVIHQDLKPDNIQVGDYGEVLVCDWGLGKVLTENHDDSNLLSTDPELLSEVTLIGEIKGTPGYMAPEQAGEDWEKGPWTDVYALGAILYSILSCRCPHEGSTAEVLQQTCMGNIVAPSLRGDTTISGRLDAVVLKAMALRPESRYTAVSQLREEVSQYLAGHATRAENASLMKLTTLMIQRHGSIFFTIFSAVMALLIAGLIFISELKQSESLAIQQRIIAVDERVKAVNALELYQMQRSISENKDPATTFRVFRSGVNTLATALNNPSPSLEDFLSLESEIEKQSSRESRNLLEQQRWQGNRGLLSFVQQDINGVKAAIDDGWPAPAIMADICGRYSPMNDTTYHWLSAGAVDGRELLRADSLIDICREMLGQSGSPNLPLKYKILEQDPTPRLFCKLIEVIMIYDGLVRIDRREHSRIVKMVLHLNNPEWSGVQFEYQPLSHHLVIGGYGLERLTSQFSSAHPVSMNLLQSLKPQSIVFRQSRFDQLSQLQNLRLNSLDLRETECVQATGISRLKELKHLYSHDGQINRLEMLNLKTNLAQHDD